MSNGKSMFDVQILKRAYQRNKLFKEPELEGESDEMPIIQLAKPMLMDGKEVDHYSLDGYLKANLDYQIDAVTKHDYDCFIIVSGREGFGKSTIASQIALYLDPTYNLDRCCFTSSQFIEASQKAEKFQAIVFDETMGYLSSRGAMSKFNRDLVKIFSEMRSKNLFVILCIPNFFELDRYPAMHRSQGLIYVYARGHFASYDYRTKKKLYVDGKKYYTYKVPPNFHGKFVRFFALNKVDYEAKKQKSINEWKK